MLDRKRIDSAFHVPLLLVAMAGSLLCGAFYTAILTPIFPNPILIRYALCHWVAEASVWLFCIAMVALAYKYSSAWKQLRATSEGSEILRKIVEARLDLAGAAREDGLGLSQWLDTVWRSQNSSVLRSWLGQRVTEFLSRQLKRRNTKQMDEDLRDLADQDNDAQHSSHAMIRIICWAMPMLGFLGTVLGISDTLGHMDAQALASGSQEAMNSLTSGLYVAFDTTAVGLVLTMIAMFIQFAIQRTEMRLLSRIDSSVANSMHECLSMPETPADTTGIQQAIRTMTTSLFESVQQLVQKQAELWRDTITDAHGQWVQVSDGAAEAAKASLLPALRDSLLEHREAVREQSENLVRLQAEGAQQLDSRLQQWQTTLSEQARTTLRLQQEINRQAELLQGLLESSQLVGAMQAPMEATLNRLTDVDRFHDAAVCLMEAVAFLSTQMERHGLLGRQAARRRTPDPQPSAATSESTPLQVVHPDEPNDEEGDETTGNRRSPWKRRAG
ncbi:MAG: MotA/TolQ/ExbB proton channel family protein [Planctomycetota bacterium]|jgi:biopolymer transport protein ExbB/TolQ